MYSLRQLVSWTVLGAASAAPAMAHEAHPEASGVVHVLAAADHLAGFVLIGALCGFFLYFSRDTLYVYGALLPIVLLASHAHAPLTTQTGLLFGMGFLGVGAIVVLTVARSAMVLIARLGLRPPHAGQD